MRMKFALILALLLAIGVSPAMADVSVPGAALVTQSGSTGLAAQTCLTTDTAVSTQQTLTVPSPGGNNAVYFDFILATLKSTGAVTTSATVLTFTTTNISGTPSFPVASGGLSAAGSVNTAAGLVGTLAIPIKALVGTSPTIVGPTATAATQGGVTACWHTGP